MEILRCGYCGVLCNTDFLPLRGKEREEAIRLIEEDNQDYEKCACALCSRVELSKQQKSYNDYYDIIEKDSSKSSSSINIESIDLEKEYNRYVEHYRLK